MTTQEEEQIRHSFEEWYNEVNSDSHIIYSRFARIRINDNETKYVHSIIERFWNIYHIGYLNGIKAGVSDCNAMLTTLPSFLFSKIL